MVPNGDRKVTWPLDYAMRKTYYLVAVAFAAGMLAGGIVFSGVKPRPPLNIHECTSNCWHPNEIAGLLAAVVIQNMPGVIPHVILETDKTVVIRYPQSIHKIHYIFAPKKDIKNIGELTNDDKEYLVDLYAAVAAVVNKEGIKNYRLWTNGPGKQEVTYLHFHLVAQ